MIDYHSNDSTCTLPSLSLDKAAPIAMIQMINAITTVIMKKQQNCTHLFLCQDEDVERTWGVSFVRNGDVSFSLMSVDLFKWVCISIFQNVHTQKKLQ